ncbi:MAG TPA: ATP-binding protein [Thermoanaerobaculia bacterium]|nr:ATP-binding protein [Thermoanaerobaculia bacterium]
MGRLSSSSLQSRLLAAVGILVLVAVAAVALAARQGARRHLFQYVALERRAVRADVVDTLRTIAAGSDGELSAERLRRSASRLPPGVAALLVDARGGLVAAAGNPLRAERLATRRERGYLVVTGALAGPPPGAFELRMRGVGVPVRLPDGSPATLEVLTFPSSRQGRHAATVLGSLDRRLVAATAAAGALALLLTWWVSRRVLEPVRQLQEATRDLALGRLERRVPVTGADELAELAGAFNGMAAELQRQQQLRRDLTGDVAHELRTPLTAMICRLEALQDGLETDAGTLAGFHHELFHLARLVEDLQELALAEAGQLRVEILPCSVAAAASSAARAAGLEGDPRLRLEVDPAVEVEADAARLRQVLTNLLTNAARHTPDGGTIRVLARREREMVAIEVADTGSGLTAEQLPLVFERFYRTDPARQRATGGSGLGLAIVKTLVEAQGGRVWVRSAPGEGAVFGVVLRGARSRGAESP